MDNEQARLILRACRPGGQDASDPLFAEALEMARVDPELAAWLAEERRFDEAMTEALQALEPPKHLRQALGTQALSRRSTTAQRAWPASWLALAAALALFLGLSLLFQQGEPPMTGEQIAREVIELAASGKIALGKFSNNPDDLQSWLAARGSPHGFAIPAGLRAYPGIGCQTYLMGGAKVSLICFRLGKDEVIHLFVVDEDALKNAPGKLPSIIRDQDKVAATWSAGGKTYVLMGMHTSEETLRRLI